MTHNHRDNPIPEPPKPRDGIESWLDVLTSMLSLPPSQRTQVRDELEDHLRSRVDDLLIHGKAESDAITTAIAELGETAQLARHISSANRTPKSFRRFAMNATFFVLAGSILTASVSMMMPSAPQQQTGSAAETETMLAAPEEIAYASLLDSFTVDVRNASLADLIEQIDRNIERPLIVHWQLIADLGYDRDAPVDIDADAIPAGLALTILAERTERDLKDSIAVLEKDNRIEIGTRSQFDRRTREERIYDLSMFASKLPEPATQDTMLQIRELLQSHVSPDSWVNLGGDAAAATILNTTLVVSAPDRIHTEVTALLSKLIEQHQAQQREERTRTQHAIAQIKEEYLSVREQMVSTKLEMRRLTDEINLVSRTSPASNDPDPEAKRKEIHQRYEDISREYQTRQYELDELKSRYDYLESKLIESEYQELIALLD